jgi:FlaA1/EpsC-like NDP-sugar epimerase
VPLLRRHRWWQIAVDAAIIAGAWYFAFLLRFDKGIPPVYDSYWRRSIVIVVAVKLGVLLLSGWYLKWWRYVSLRDVQVLVRSLLRASSCGSRSRSSPSRATSACRSASRSSTCCSR